MTSEHKTKIIEGQKLLFSRAKTRAKQRLINLTLSDKKLIYNNLEKLSIFENKVFDLKFTGLFRRLTLSYRDLIGLRVLKNSTEYTLLLRTELNEIKVKLKK